MAALPARPLLAATAATASPSLSPSNALSRAPVRVKPTVSSRITGQVRTGRPVSVQIAIANVGIAGARLSFSSDRPLKLGAAKPRRLPPGDSSLTLRATARSPGVHFIYVSLQHDGGGSLTPIPVEVRSREAKASSAKASKGSRPSKAPETDNSKKSTNTQAMADTAKKRKKKKKKNDGGAATGTRSHE
ncbi:hypothetical protein [Xylophilus sp. GOD-11R]|uniref:hypothetical protein n=1 Tax=Xylophilus sp. GOD-11R TaxID=3089814 RepID=UPI00298CDF65|nr:hypothetical protein [Xylophilus sp. GOD-11R]WPB59181.1 hypothetical protein R9X41_11265 [Xylophilus sp. GOD-11R]